ncbi:MAG: cyclic nucleotide-binding domain-containing protein [Anaerolineae bacterium]
MAERVELPADEIVAHLAATDLFSLLDPVALGRLAPLFGAVRYGPGQLVAAQREVDETLWVVANGQVSADRKGEDGVVSHLAFHGYGTVLGERGVFIGEPRRTSCITVEPTLLLHAGRDELWAVLGADPDLFDLLVLSDDVRSRLEMFDVSSSLDGEYQVALFRRHWSVMLRRMFAPLVLLLVCLAIAAGLSALSSVAVSSSPMLVLVFAIVGLGVPLIGAVWAYFDYHYDCLIVTNRRIIHVERTPFIDTQRSEAFLTSIQDVNRVTPGVMARMLGYGDVTVQTASSGGAMRFTKVANPQQVRTTIFEQADRARDRAVRERQAWITRQVQEAIDGGTPVAPPANGAAERRGEPVGESFPAYLAGVLSRGALYFWPKTRVQEGSVVTWRKHWWVLLRSAVVPLLLLTLLGAGALYAWWSLGEVPWIAVGAVWLVLAMWLLWIYEDWRNDLYQLTDEHIIDVERRPLGFFEERRQAGLGQIQDVRYVVPNPLATLLNFGNVQIETAAEIGNFTFDFVYHPSGVQEEIFTRIDQYQRRLEREEEERRAEEMSRWISTYHRLSGGAAPAASTGPGARGGQMPPRSGAAEPPRG